MKKIGISFTTRLIGILAREYNNLYRCRWYQRVILTYHGISKTPKVNCITQELFEKQIQWLKTRYSIVALSALVENIQNSSLMDKPDLLSITFDDGFINFAELALPILQKYNYPATIFVPAGKVGGYNDWDEEMDDFHKMRIMSYSDLRQLPHNVVEIGSHGINHIPIDSKLTDKEISEEINKPRLILEQNIGRRVQFFAFPYGVLPFRINSKGDFRQRNLLTEYRAACTSWWGRYNSSQNIYTLRRVGIWHIDSFDDFVNKLNGCYDWLEAKEKIGMFYRKIRGL